MDGHHCHHCKHIAYALLAKKSIREKMTKNVLITGAAGFIGFHLAKALHKRGDRVVGYDNYNAYYDTQLKHDRAKQLIQLGVPVIQGDICDAQQLLQVMQQHETTHIVHLAAQAGVRYSLQNPQAYLKSNIDGFLNVLELCRSHPHLKLTYASSSSVYGQNTKIPFAVEDRTDEPASLYAMTKKSNELMASSYHHLFGISVTGLRFFTVYGPWGRPDMAYFLFTKAIVEGRPIDVYNQGNMQRDFTYIDDIVAGTIAAIDCEYACEIFNLGNHQPEPLLGLIELIEKEVGLVAQKRWLPMQAGDVVSTYADIEYSTAKLGFLPTISLEQGIGRFIKWYKAYYL
jgi:UDP-glucuronate 4-epimerase